MSWASFASIELMSSSRFAHKRIAYLAASQGFTQDTEVILLTTNLLKKELRGGVYEAGLAINCISNIVTEDLAKDLLPELTSLSAHPQPYLRKKAILCLFKVFVKYPQGLRLTFTKIQQSLDDTNPSVVSCAVNVITELSDKNPKNYLHLAPSFFQLLTTSSNNWMLIKVVKLLGSLVPEEPRLARKLLEPLADIVRNTKAKSLLYEACHTITKCLPYCRRSDGTMPANVPDIVSLCAETLQSFVREADQNLKYLGLVGFASLMQSHPRALSAPGYRPIILACLSDQDVTIRSRALSLLTGMASRKNLIELVTQLLKHVELATGSYKLDLVAKIVEICSSDKYALLQDFGWYLDVLFQLGHMRGLDAHSTLLRSQISDVALRVLPVRPFAVRRSLEILLERDGVCSADPSGDNGRGRHIMPEILPGAAWIVGEYSDLIRDSLSSFNGETGDELLLSTTSKGTYHSIIQAVTSTSNFQKLPASTQEVYLQAALKVFAAATADSMVGNGELEAACDTLRQNIPLYLQSNHVEVQERAFTALSLLASLGLLSNHASMPGLRAVDIDSSDDDNDGDLLGMDSGAAISTPSQCKDPPPSQKLPPTCRKASSVLNFVLKPSPMKPTSVKSQRKKSQSPLGVDFADINSVDMTAFSTLFDDPLASSVSMELVSFTAQDSWRLPARPAVSMGASAESLHGSAGDTPLMSGGDTISGFRHGFGDALESSSGARPNQADPFYLDSSPKLKADEDTKAGQFGMIQLSDSDEGAEDNTSKKKKKKKKKSSKPKHKHAFPLGAMPGSSVAVYDSDDDGLAYSAGPSKNSQSRRPGKEFESLAKVDLTEPLREDEVMPERRHRIVPEAPQIKNEPPLGHHSRNVSKKGKKEKKSKKQKKKGDKDASGSYENVGDLLELGGFGSPTAEQNFPASNQPSHSSANAINDAFDDLLGLELQTAAHAPSQTLQPISPFASPGDATRFGNFENDSQPWIRATVKETSTDSDLAKLRLHFKVFRTTHAQGVAVMLKIRVANPTGAVLSSLILTLKGQTSLSLGNVGPSAVKESNSVGPFVYSASDFNFTLKATVSASGSTVSVKLRMPMSVHLLPRQGLSLDDVSAELSSPAVVSRSIKLKLSQAITPDKAKIMLLNFLGAAEVDMGVARGSSSAVTFASQSTQGDQLLALLKFKTGSVKVDLKCTSTGLGVAVASDLKKLEL